MKSSVIPAMIGLGLAAQSLLLLPPLTPIAAAQSSGGRSSGGSFNRPSSRPNPSGSGSRSSSPPRSNPNRNPNSRPYPDRQRTNDWNQPNWDRGGGPVLVPIPSYPRYPTYPSYPDRPREYESGNREPSDFDRRPDLPNVNGTEANPNANPGSPTLATPPPAATIPTATTAPAEPGFNPAWLLIPGGAIVVGGGLLLYKAQRQKTGAAPAGSPEERNNDIVTVSEVQLALLANSPIQQQLTAIVEAMEITTPEQLKDQLQAVVLDLLRLTEYWSHAQGHSQTFPDRQQAESHFNQGSMQTRAKLSKETLTRDSLGLRQQAITLDQDEDPAAYVVVTLRLGTTHDRPLFLQLHSAAEVEAVLNKFASLTTAELLTFELIWSPQAATDSLSRDELMTQYTALVML